MKNMKQKRLLLLIVSMLCCGPQKLESYFTLLGNGTAPGTTNGTTCTLGLGGLSSSQSFLPTSEGYFGMFGGNGIYAVSYFSFRNAQINPYIIPLAQDPALSNATIISVSAVQNPSDISSPTVVALINADTHFYALSKSNTTAVRSPQFNDPAGNPTAQLLYGQVGYTSLGGAANVLIAPLKVQGGAGIVWGAGVAGTTGTNTDGISAAFVSQSNGNPLWEYVGANGATNIATRFDLTTTGSFLISDGATPITNIQGGSYHYDGAFQRFYVALQATVAANPGHINGMYAIGIYPVSTSGNKVTVGAQLLPCGTPNTSIHGDTAAVVSVPGSIIGFSQNNRETTAFIYDIAVMHTSTGMGYLIVGGNTIDSTGGVNVPQIVANQVYAIPLVNGDPGNPTTGCFANVNSGNRTALAVNAGDLVTTASPAAVVGGGPLPITNSLLAGQPFPNGIQVVSCTGDVVGDVKYEVRHQNFSDSQRLMLVV